MKWFPTRRLYLAPRLSRFVFRRQPLPACCLLFVPPARGPSPFSSLTLSACTLTHTCVSVSPRLCPMMDDAESKEVPGQGRRVHACKDEGWSDQGDRGLATDALMQEVSLLRLDRAVSKSSRVVDAAPCLFPWLATPVPCASSTRAVLWSRCRRRGPSRHLASAGLPLSRLLLAFLVQ